MPGAKEGHEQRAQAEAHPFEDDVRPFGREFEQKCETDGEVEKPHRTLTTGEDSPTPGGDAKGVWNQAPLIP
jgi:hypothetical protein